MTLEELMQKYKYILTQAAIDEVLSRSDEVEMHPRLGNALFIYDEKSRRLLTDLYEGFIDLAIKAGVPMLIYTPTWRANPERLEEAGVYSDVNKAAGIYMNELRDAHAGYKDRILIGGDMGCKNDAYRPEEALCKEEAYDFHAWQIERLISGNIDFLAAGPMPAVSEAVGMALAMGKSGLPYTLNFVINREGRMLDGTPLFEGIRKVDEACSVPPHGYVIGCSYPSFFNPDEFPAPVLSRVIGFQGNASSLDHSSLDGAETVHADDVSDWGGEMVKLYRKYQIKILGGCCGTRLGHLQYIIDHIDDE